MGERPEWYVLYAAAMLETDSSQLPLRVQKADAAIRARLKQLPENPSGRSEQSELRSALNYLRLLNVA